MPELRLKILVISANYPPEHSGGYELRIRDIIDGLDKKGHAIRVLTTLKNYFTVKKSVQMPYPIYRFLHNRNHAKFFPKEVFFDLLDTKFVDHHIKDFKPDVIYLGHIYILSKALLPFLANLKTPIVLDEGGASLKGAWTERGRWFRFIGDYGEDSLLIRFLKPFVIKLVELLSKGRIKRNWRWPERMHVIINNRHNLENLQALGIPLKNAQVIYSGIDTEKFSFVPREKITQPVKIICPSRIEKRKGVLDCVELVNVLKKSEIESQMTIVGAIASTKFHQKVLERIKNLSLQDQISVSDIVPQETLIGLYQQMDICFFPSYQKMGFSRTPLEAMACGCVVISYGNEGSNEILLHEQNGFVVQDNNAEEIVNIINKLSSNPEMANNIVKTALKEIEENYSLPAYVNRIEDTLISVINSNSL